MKKKILGCVTILSFSTNPFLKKLALQSINKDTGYALSQLTNFSTIFLYLLVNRNVVDFNNVNIKNISYSIISSIVTLCGSLSMIECLKDSEHVSVYMANINTINILTTSIIDSYYLNEPIGFKKSLGIFFLCIGLQLIN